MPQEQRADQALLVQQVWDYYLREIILNQEYERLGFAVTDGEIAFYTRNKPPQAVHEFEVFQTDGAFDMDKYAQFIGNPANLSDPNSQAIVLWIESAIERQLLEYRLQRMLLGHRPGESQRSAPALCRGQRKGAHRIRICPQRHPG